MLLRGEHGTANYTMPCEPVSHYDGIMSGATRLSVLDSSPDRAMILCAMSVSSGLIIMLVPGTARRAIGGSSGLRKCGPPKL